jgi:hypothetical protein
MFNFVISCEKRFGSIGKSIFFAPKTGALEPVTKFMQCFQITLTYSATVVSYVHTIFIKSTIEMLPYGQQTVFTPNL